MRISAAVIRGEKQIKNRQKSKKDKKQKKQPFSGLTNTKKSASCQIVTSQHITSPNVGKKRFRMEQRGGGGRKKCLPRAIYPPPIMKSHRHDPIRCRRAIWDQKFENLWDHDPILPSRRAIWGLREGNMGTEEGNMGSFPKMIPWSPPILLMFFIFLHENRSGISINLLA